ncbi:polymeric immunoglobulin receptor-like isoform X2 [Pagrus major]|uniref:polymeric immunoglobulin receptor-like isoform X2 n=1 Tax=Pagrus major TaxID=143350 RepID=UPI003CC8615B
MRMWSLQSLSFTLCIALSCVTTAAGLIRVYGYEGGEVDVPCPYGEGYEFYVKYLCKNNCASEDVVIMTTGAKKSKYSIKDDQTSRVFTATISDLSHADAGKYWCGVERNGKDIYTEVKLQVEQDTCCDQSIKLQSNEEATVSFGCPYESVDQNNLKYICRGNLSSTCLQQALINSTSQQNGKFRLHDDRRLKTFKATIINVTQTDSGRYLCGVHRDAGLDVFTAVDLQVKEWCCVKSKKQSGTVGGQVTMRCPYPPQHKNYRKFLCRGGHRKNCAGMVTSRFTPQDNPASSIFSVTIKELKPGDAGTYWCVSDPQWSAGNYTKIQLSVDATVPHPVVFIVPAVLLILTLAALVLVYKYKCHKVQEATVVNNSNKTEAPPAEKVMDGEDLYANQDVVHWGQDASYGHYDDAGEDSVYQNTDDIYCNQFPMKAKR